MSLVLITPWHRSGFQPMLFLFSEGLTLVHLSLHCWPWILLLLSCLRVCLLCLWFRKIFLLGKDCRLTIFSLSSLVMLTPLGSDLHCFLGYLCTQCVFFLWMLLRCLSCLTYNGAQCTCVSCFILHFIVLIRFFFYFNKLKVCGDLVLRTSSGAIFPTAFDHIVSLSHFGNSCDISSFFIIILFVVMICDQWLWFSKSLDDGWHFLVIKHFSIKMNGFFWYNILHA